MRRAASMAVAAAAIAAALAAQQFKLPPQPAPAQFGNVLIRRGTLNGPAKPVAFSHWSHRIRYTCRVCHLELGFEFKRNTTEITEEANRSGAYCGACHDGKTAFAHTSAHCDRCHTGTTTTSADFGRLSNLPSAPFGNAVDWSAALSSGRIKPRHALVDTSDVMTLDTLLTLEAEWNFVPPAIFPHTEHVRWLDCANCHPALFNVKKKGTKHFSMQYNLRGEFCGVCHLHVAFPMDDCKRCHPAIENAPL